MSSVGSVFPYPAGILQNTQTGRFHPIIFRPGPTPGSSGKEDIQRYKSKGHHTEGFDTIEEAEADIKETPGLHDMGCRWKWDGEDIPAIVWWFSESDLLSRIAEDQKN